MITMFQSSKKPLAKAVHVFDEASDAKWVPLNKSFITLASIVLRAAASRIKVANISMTLRCITHQGYRHLLLAGEELDHTISALGAVEEFIISDEIMPALPDQTLGSPQTVSFAIDHQSKRLGYLVARLHDTGAAGRGFAKSDLATPEQIELGLAEVTKDIIAIIKRYQTRYRAIFIYGDQYYWIGNSLALRQLDQVMEQLASASHPILIRGDKGTGKNIAARTLHSLRHTNILPFIESSCHEWQDGAAMTILHALYAYAKGGTLYLRNVDLLSESNFKALQQFWAENYLNASSSAEADSVGIILSVSRYHYAASPELKAWLTDFTYELALPDLAARREDVRDLVRFYIREYTLSMEFDFSDDAWQILQNFTWRDNVDQLKRVVQKVAILADEPVVQANLLEAVLRDSV